MHIGLIGGIGPAATEFYYRNLVRAHVDANRALELTILHADIRDLVQNMSDGAPDKQAEIFLRLTRRLQGAGAEAVAVTSIAGHFCIRELEALSPAPVVNAIPEIEAALVNRGLRRVGLLGTRSATALASVIWSSGRAAISAPRRLQPSTSRPARSHGVIAAWDARVFFTPTAASSSLTKTGASRWPLLHRKD